MIFKVTAVLMMTGLALVAVAVNASVGDVLLRVKPHVVVPPASEVKLRHLVDAQGLSAAGEKKLAAVILKRSPDQGGQEELRSRLLMPALREIAAGERKQGRTRVHFVVPETVTIDTLKRELSREQVAQELAVAWQPLCPECRLTVEDLSLPKVAGVRDWTLKVKPELPRGGFSVAVEVIREDGGPLPAWINGRLIVKRKVPVARKLLNAGERLQPQDFIWEYRDTANAYDSVPAPGELTGRRVRQALKSGDILFRGQLEKEKAVLRGERVQVRSSEGPWEISLGVVAQQDAYIGDIVSLKNPSTNSALIGVVIGQGEVELR